MRRLGIAGYCVLGALAGGVLAATYARAQTVGEVPSQPPNSPMQTAPKALRAAPVADALPQPLTLEQALSLAEEAHPALRLQHAAVLDGDAALAQAHARDDAELVFELTPQAIHPTNAADDEFVDDSRARLILGKTLYDFGRTRHAISAADANRRARLQRYADARAQQRITIMRRFFDVLLADLRYAVDNEAMAQAFVQFDRLRDRHGVGQVSDIDLLESEDRFQVRRVQRQASLARQSASRQRLALALNRPGTLPRDLTAPKLADLGRALPEFDALLPLVLQHNPVLLAARKEREATHATLAAERRRAYPVLRGEAEAAYYERELASRDDRRVMLSLRVPLYQGGAVDAAVAGARAAQAEQEARLALAEFDLRDALYALLQEMELLTAKRQAAAVRTKYRDLYLDRSRALYELEVRTDLGDAMVRNTEAAYESAQADYELALAWARLRALLGEAELPETSP